MTGRNQTLADCLPDYRRWLYRVAHDLTASYAGHYTAVAADDLVQEGYVAMFRALDTYDPGRGALPSWLTGAARLRMREVASGHSPQSSNLPADRTTSRPPIVDSTDRMAEHDSDLLDQLTTTGDGLDGVVFAYHDGEIAQAIDRLPPAQRRYVLARFYAGLDPTSRQPDMRALVNLVPELADRHLWGGRNGAKERLARDLAHLAPLVAS